MIISLVKFKIGYLTKVNLSQYGISKKVLYRIKRSIKLGHVHQLSSFILDKRKQISFNIPNVQIARKDSLAINERIQQLRLLRESRN